LQGFGVAVRTDFRLILARVLLTLCVLALSPGAVLAAEPFEVDPSKVGWSRLLFRASDARASVAIEVRLTTAPASDLEDPRVPVTGGAVVPPAGDEVSLLTAFIVVEGYDKAYRNEVWFLPGEAVPLQRRRDKLGKGPNRKTFRYAGEGVYRVRLDPAGPQEEELRPEQWTGEKTHFYPYGPAARGCPAVTDPALLLLAVSAGAVSEDGAPLDLCAFNKKTVYQVRAATAGVRPLEVAYAEIGKGVRAKIERAVAAPSVRIVARPGEAADPDPFEFFELTGDIEIALDPSTRIPVLISGDLPGLGRVDFALSEVTLFPINVPD
jgi:hypothetical protein